MPDVPAAPPSVPGFRGQWRIGEEARERANRVSGPFRREPFAWAAPRDAEDLSLLVRFAAGEGLAIVPRGGGTGMPGGNVGPGIVVSLEHFSHVGPAADGRIRAEAGAALAEVAGRAAAAGFVFPPAPASLRWASVGGVVANNSAGARSFAHGATSAWTLELEGIRADGEPFRVGPSDPPPALRALELEVARGPDGRIEGWPGVRKNSSGYALDRFLPERDPVQLLVGSEGTLCVLTAATLRLAPVPEAAGVHLLAVRTAEEAGHLAEAAAAELRPAACEFLGRRLLEMAGLDRDPWLGPVARGAFALFLLGFEGDGEAVDEGLERARAFGTSRLWGPSEGVRDPERAELLWSLRHRASPLIALEAGRGRFSTQFIEDSVVPPARLGAYLRGLERILDEAGFDSVVFGHAGDGNVHVNPLVDTTLPDWQARVRRALEDTVELVAGLGGTLAGEHGDGRLRAPFLERIWGPELMRAFREIKDAFDPDGVLNPGVVLPLPGQDPLEGLEPGRPAWPRGAER